MKKYGGLLLVCFLLPALYSVQRPAGRMETALPAAGDSIPRQTQEPAETGLVFPDYVDGGGWSIQLVLSNVDPKTVAEAVVEVYGPGGRPVRDLFDSELTLEIPSLGSRVLKSAGVGPVRRGWIEVETDSASVSGLLTYRHAQSGIEVGVKPIALGERFALFVEESPTVGAGVAIFKPDASAGVEMRIQDEDGNDPLEGVIVSWDDDEFHQAARTLPEWFTVEGIDTEFLRDFHGLLFLETGDESPFAPLGLRFGKQTSSLSSVPAIRNPSQEPQASPLIFPDYVDGDGWSVQLVLSNVDTAVAATAGVEVYDPGGQPVEGLFDSELRLEIPPLGSRVLKSFGDGPIRRGWIQVETDPASVSGLLTYRHAQSGIEVSVEPVPLGTQFALFVEETETIGAGLALFKPDGASRVDLRIRDEEGNDPLAGVFLPWKDFRQAALTLPEWFDVAGVDAEFLKDFRGLLFLRSEDDTPFVPLGLRFGKRSASLSSVPAIRIPDGGEIGGGYPPPPTVTLAASPVSIDRGQSMTLTWSSTSAERAEITPEIGVVPTSGTRKVSPKVTTTYRITVTGADGQTATAAVTVTVTVSERAALGALFDSLRGSGWTRSDNWLTDAPLGDWYGVEVDSQGRVVELRMAAWAETADGDREKIGNELTGVIPPELGALSHLKILDLSNNRLQGEIPAEIGNLSNLTWLDLSRNQLAGKIPPELGRLSQLQSLDLEGNSLTGPIPASFLRLDQLTNLSFDGNRGLCAPGTTDFVAWVEGIERYFGSYCNESDVAVLDTFYRNTGGEDWTNSGGWLGSVAVSEWYGVRADSLGRVTALDLSRNGLTGRLPGILGQLKQLTELRIDGNALAGRVPLGLARLPLQAFHYTDTKLCAPVEESFQVWLNTISSHEGTRRACAPLTDRDVLVSLYDATDGPNWTQSEKWLTDAPLSDWSWVQVDNHGHVIGLYLQDIGLTGPIPPELGYLPRLERLYLWGNQLTGPIPPELGSLTHLRVLELWANRLTGPIPPELENLSGLEILDLSSNQLTGPIPPDLGGMENLRTLSLSWNTEMSGSLPGRLTDLRRLEALLAVGTDLCAPSDIQFLDWLEGVWKRRVPHCSRGSLPMAYLTQAVQSREFPVPLVAGEEALLRVFVTATGAGGQGIPPVRARFYIDGGEAHVVDIPGQSTPIPTEVREDSLPASANAEVPGKIVQPGLEMVIEVDPHGILDSRVGIAKRIPKKGRLAVDVQTMPVFDLTLVPFIWSETHDSSIVGMIEDMAANPESHELLRSVVTLLPVGDLVVRAHEPVLSTTNNASEILSQITAIRAMEGGRGHYLGMMPRPTTGAHGLANRAARSTFSLPHAFVIGHEIGHTFDLDHAACGTSIRGLDPSFPYPGGSIGAWGHDFRDGGRLVPPAYTDLMGYCNQRYWISDYHFTNALRYRLHTVASGGVSSLMAAPVRSLLLWGGVHAGGAPFLEPAFVVEAPASLPRSTGEYGIVGRTADGDELFSLPFQMPVVADGDGRSSFAFALPVQPEWSGELASITLSGPGGSVTLDQDTNRPVTILRNPQTGQIRAILRGAEAAPQNLNDTVSTLSLDPGLERLTSRGIPDSEDWTR